MKDFTDYKFRPSSLGKLMTNPRSKSEALSETTKSYLQELFIEEVFGRRKDIMNKYLEKGLLVEEDSLDLISKHYGKLFIKNKEKLSNEFMTGTPDIITEKVIDIKSSWDLFTFPMFDEEIPTKDYYWQLQAYMWLAGKTEADLVYCLNNSPEHLIVAEKRKQMYNRGLLDQEGTPEFDEMEKEVEKNMIFTDIEPEKRIKVFSIPFNAVEIEQVKVRIFEARAYLNKLSAL